MLLNLRINLKKSRNSTESFSSKFCPNLLFKITSNQHINGGHKDNLSNILYREKYTKDK